jgi:hypothetical protein
VYAELGDIFTGVRMRGGKDRHDRAIETAIAAVQFCERRVSRLEALVAAGQALHD